MALHKEVYLPLAASLVEVQTYLATLHERTPEERTVMTEFAAASARLAMVAASDTALMAQQLSAEIAILSMELTIGALPAIHAKAMIKIHQDMKCAAEARAECARVKMDEFLRSGVVDENVFNAIRRVTLKDTMLLSLHLPWKRWARCKDGPCDQVFTSVLPRVMRAPAPARVAGKARTLRTIPDQTPMPKLLIYMRPE